MTSSSRGGLAVSGGVRSQSSSSLATGVGDAEALLRALVVASSDSTRPSRSSRWRVVYTWPVFSGHISPVPASNSWRELQAVLRPFAEQCEHRVADAHRSSLLGGVLGGVCSVLFAVHYSVHYS